MIPDTWYPYRRADGELLGWIHPEADLWVAVDVLGRTQSTPVEWLEAEETLDSIGIGWLADPWILDREEAGPLRVRILEVTPHASGPGRIVVKPDDFGDISASPAERIELPWPLPATLRVPEASDPDGKTIG